MRIRVLALMLIVCVLTLLAISGNTTASSLRTPTATVTRVAVAQELTEEATAEVTQSATAEVTEMVLVGDPVRGEDIFRNGLYGAPPCITCHSPIIAGRGGYFSIGPGLKDIGERGATRIEGLTAPEYIEDSIRHPTHFIVPGFNPVMPPIFGEQYSDQDIADLIAFLMTV